MAPSTRSVLCLIWSIVCDRRTLTDEHAVEILSPTSEVRSLSEVRGSVLIVFHKLDDVPPDFGPTLVSVGNFDGVHRAHAHVLREIVTRARQSGARAVAVTFEPHPARILRPDSGLKLL